MFWIIVFTNRRYTEHLLRVICICQDFMISLHSQISFSASLSSILFSSLSDYFHVQHITRTSVCTSIHSHDQLSILPWVRFDVYRFGRKRLELLVCHIIEENDSCWNYISALNHLCAPHELLKKVKLKLYCENILKFLLSFRDWV